jgi:4a-hydroxytetrahydrobiopterin dehydratase
MDTLSQQHCVACQAGAPRLTETELVEAREQLPHWNVVERDGILRLERTYKLPNFVDALRLTNLIGDLAEAEGHHPAITTEWGRVTVTWWTHKIKGLHLNDTVMAAKSDRAANEVGAS